MIFREATIEDIPQLHRIRTSVKENCLSNPDLITSKDYEQYLTHFGKGWLCEINKVIIGFAIVDLHAHNVWALFIQPGFDKKGVGRRLHDDMLDWYFIQTKETIWLSTSPKTRAEGFYRKAGWVDKGVQANGEIRFECRSEDWKRVK